jgi:hypothetical protein
MVRSGGGIEWLILIYIYYTKIYVTLYSLNALLALNFKSYYKTVCYEDQLVFTLYLLCIETLCL